MSKSKDIGNKCFSCVELKLCPYKATMKITENDQHELDELEECIDANYVKDENRERGNWSGRIDFLFSMLGYSVGLGNIWRFPYLCYRNGGGVFLIPYILTLVCVGIPAFFLEINIAQFSSLGTLHCWQFAPLFQGLGIAMVTISFITALYYNMLLGYALIYLVSSFTSYLPWSDCNNSWNGPGCSHKLPLLNCSDNNATSFSNGTCFNETDFVGLWNASIYKNETGIKRVSPSEEYFNKQVLGRSEGIEFIGNFEWKLVLGLAVAWTIVFLCVCRSVKSSGKVVYITATFPYVLLCVFLVRALLLDGAYEGISFYIKPKNWEQLLAGKVWRDAATQIFYSMGMGWGGLHALASYNKFHNNSLRDSLIVSLGTCLTSVFAGFVVFSYLGTMAHNMNTTIDTVVQSGPGLVFIVYPEAFTYMPLPSLWSILFFLMIISVGLDTQFVMVETVTTSVFDMFPKLRPKKSLAILVVCICMLFIGLPITTSAGIYILLLIDNFASWICLPVVVLLECISIGYIYGAERFMNDVSVMLGYHPCVYFKVCWMVTTPLLILFVLIFPLLSYNRFTYDGVYVYPIWAEVTGWLITLLPLFLAICFSVYLVVKTPGTLTQRLKQLLSPSQHWRPYLPQHRRLIKSAYHSESNDIALPEKLAKEPIIY